MEVYAPEVGAITSAGGNRVKQRICLLLLSGMLFLPSGAAAYTGTPQPSEQSLILIDESDTNSQPVVINDPIEENSENTPVFDWKEDYSCYAIFPNSILPQACTVTSKTIQPTCTAEGSVTYTASVESNGITYTDTKTVALDKLAHEPVTDPAVEATCTKTGLTEGSHCKNCGTVLSAQTVIPAKRHNKVTISGVKPTCTKTGLTEGIRCTRCGIILQNQETIPATGHRWSAKWVSRKATPTQNGMYSRTCTTCHVSEAVAQFPRLGYVATTTRTYTGSKLLTEVRVINSKGTRLSSSNFSVTYDNPNSKTPGIYGLTVTMHGSSYSGTLRATYKIRPKSTTMSKLTAQKGAFAAQWTKKTTQVTGYQLQYSLRKDSDVAVTKTVKSNKTTKLTVKNLKNKRNYYVRVRTYKQVGSNKICSVWSPWVRVTTK